MQHPVTSPRLPQELIDRIIDEVGFGYRTLDAPLELQSLLTCSLASRLFLPRCRTHTFEKIRIVAPQANIADLGQVRRTENRTHEEHLQDFHEILQKNPDLASYIHTLDFDFPSLHHASEDTIFPDIMHQLDKLTRLTLSSPERDLDWETLHPAVQSAVRSACSRPTIVELAFEGFTNFPIDLCPSFSPSLKFLKLTNLTPLRTGHQEFSSLPYRLDKLSVDNSWSVVDPLLGSHAAFSNIQQLNFRVNPADLVHTVVSAAVMNKVSTSLEKLCLVYSCDLPNHIEDRDNIILIEDLPALKDATIAVCVCEIVYELPCPSSIPRFIVNIVRTLENVENLELIIYWVVETIPGSYDIPLIDRQNGWGELDDVLSSTEYACLRSVKLDATLSIWDPIKGDVQELKLEISRKMEEECRLALRGTREKVPLDVEITVRLRQAAIRYQA